MDRTIIEQLIIWLRRKRVGTVVHMRDFWIRHIHHVLGIVPLSATLSAKVIRKDGTVENRGVISTHAVTDAFVEALVDTLQSSVAAFSNYKYHDSGEGVTAESEANTTLESPCGEARDIGSQIEGATGNIYKSVATHVYAGSFAITEHGLFNASTVGVLMDRSVFTTISVENGDQIEWTYQLSCISGG